MKPKRQSRKRRQTPAELKALQRLMGSAVMRPLSAQNAMQERWVDGRLTRTVAAEFIKPNDRLTSFERLELYNRQYWFRIIDSLDEDYPGLRAVLGERKFKELMQAYVERHPSGSFTLRNLGRSLESFLRDAPELTHPHERLALDMARLEWAHIEAFDNEKRPTVEVDDLQGMDPGTLRLGLQPHLFLLQLDHPVDEFAVKLRKQGDDPTRGEASNALGRTRVRPRRKVLKRPGPKPVWLAVHRHDNTVYYKRLLRVEYVLLTSLREGQTLEEACGAAFEEGEHVLEDWPRQIREWFEHWTSLGWFCVVRNTLC